jgi:uncharacterized membrane protein YvlD (DUF360 family)
MNNVLTLFISELILRLFSQKPKFFVIIQWISILTGAVSALISYLGTTSLALPSWVATVGNINVMIASIIALIVAQLTNKDPQVAEKIEALKK